MYKYHKLFSKFLLTLVGQNKNLENKKLYIIINI